MSNPAKNMTPLGKVTPTKFLAQLRCLPVKSSLVFLWKNGETLTVLNWLRTVLNTLPEEEQAQFQLEVNYRRVRIRRVMRADIGHA